MKALKFKKSGKYSPVWGRIDFDEKGKYVAKTSQLHPYADGWTLEAIAALHNLNMSDWELVPFAAFPVKESSIIAAGPDAFYEEPKSVDTSVKKKAFTVTCCKCRKTIKSTKWFDNLDQIEKWASDKGWLFIFESQFCDLCKLVIPVKNRRKKHAAGWESVKLRYGNKCLCCKRSDVKLTKDHVVPLGRGGLDSLDNIQPLCVECNRAKGTKIIDYRIEADELLNTENNGVNKNA